MNLLTIEKYEENGKFSHYEFIDSDTGEIIISNISQVLQLFQSNLGGSYCSNCRFKNSCAIRIDFNIDTCEEHEH